MAIRIALVSKVIIPKIVKIITQLQAIITIFNLMIGALNKLV